MLKKTLFLLIVFVATGMLQRLPAQKNSYEIKVKIEGCSNDTVLLAYHYGKTQYVKDTAVADGTGSCVFSGEEALEPGIYLIAAGNNGYFEIIVSKEVQKFSVSSKLPDLTTNAKAVGSKECEAFFEFSQTMTRIYKEYSEISKKLEDPTTPEAEKAILNQRKSEINPEDLDKEATEYKEKVFQKNPDFFFVKVLKSMNDPEIPEVPVNPDGTPVDSNWAYRWLKKHYFDNLDFSDERMLRTPVFQGRIDRYFAKLVYPNPDSIMADCDKVIALSKANEEVYKYTVITLFNQYATSKIMGMDGVYAYLAEKYYLSGQAPWVDSLQMAKIQDRVKKLLPNLIGKTAPNLTLLDSTKKAINTNGLKSDFTVIYFWDPECGHCKKTTPLLKEWYERVKFTEKKNIEVIGITITQDEKAWKKYIRENKLKWINLMDYYGQSKMRELYDIYSTPIIYLLDKNKKIIAKRIEVSNLDDIIKNYSK